MCGVVYTYRQISSRDSITQKICNLLPSFDVLLLLFRFVEKKTIFFKMFMHTYMCCLFVFLCVIFVLSDPFDTECLGFVWFTAQFPHTIFGYMQLIFYSRPRQWWRHQPESGTHSHLHTNVATNYTWPTLSQTLPLPNMLPTMNACVCQKLDVFQISIKWILCRCIYHPWGSALTCVQCVFNSCNLKHMI